ncbi:TPA: ATP-binding protein [Burkholderia vietnamiensis]|uniref:P-loop ATPase, Sll1717 family n=1 Tax=Burkholderia vietnamiensis TaxID=60552 RepID=UPI0012D96764|nr:ATP-binding protein [Burkholderia vietnamiensis]MBR8161659.1 ATP-binding protein [Burkholderia vietnamiensis]MCA7946745.1 ATP-binding protein [Burkholderia vietnamiensis]MCA8211589.1 ATP-binding protein [Burkholderia vietnamiensis]MDN7412349.1 ATP-binding protein [Burkholderia vietnamiensis]HDR9101086.1 ATP-binding protein [Burkholderia vietnamiensis]
MDVTFESFYKNVGFGEYPFSKWSAEQERDRLHELFVRPSYYGPIDEAFKGGLGMFLIGERGTGKTAAIYDLIRDSKESNIVVLIDDFSSVPVAYNPEDLYFLIISRVSEKIFEKIFLNRRVLSRLSDSQRLLLSYVYKEYTTSTTKAELARRLEHIQVPSWRRWATKAYGLFRGLLNYGATVTVNFVADAISKSLGNIAPNVSDSSVKEYFPDIPFRSDDTFNSLDASLRLLECLADLGHQLTLGRTIVVLDKLDEDARLEGDAEHIADFLRGVVTATNLHLSQNIQLIASIWTVPFNMLRKQENVRTQKMNVENLIWDHTDLTRALNNRFSVFSSESVRNYERLGDTDVSNDLWGEVFELSNKNPRDLWHLMDSIFRQQFKINPKSTLISAAAIQEGMKSFVSSFNYYEYYPRRANAKANSMDVYAYIRHLLRLASPEFTRNQLTERSGVSGSSANNYVAQMENMGLISSQGQTGGNVNYTIRDPKIRFALQHQLEISL